MQIGRSQLIFIRKLLRDGNAAEARSLLSGSAIPKRTLVQLLPKAELHYHLDGAVRPGTIFDESVKQGIDLRRVSQRLPIGYTVEDIRRITSMKEGEEINDFMAFLTDKFLLPLEVMQTKDALERVAFEAMEDAFVDGIHHREIIFAPCLHTREGLSYQQVMDSIFKGLCKGFLNFGVSSAMRPSIYRNKVDEPAFEDHPLKTAEAAVLARDAYGEKIRIALDIVGHEAPFPPSDERYKDAFDLAISKKVLMSLHAGEQPGTADNVFYVINNLGVSRIGHGIDVMGMPLSSRQIEQLKSVTFELCPSSNVMLGNVSGGFKGFPIMRMLSLGLPPTVSTDDATVFGTTLTDEFLRLEDVPGFKIFEDGVVSETFRKLQDNALAGAFLAGRKKDNLRRGFLYYYDFLKNLLQN